MQAIVLGVLSFVAMAMKDKIKLSPDLLGNCSSAHQEYLNNFLRKSYFTKI